MRLTFILLIVALTGVSARAWAIEDNFDNREQTFRLWNDCQFDHSRENFVKAPPAYLGIGADATLGNKDKCEKNGAGKDELGPSLIDVAATLGKDCPTGDKNVHQRNELRRKKFPPASAGHWYSIRFRVEPYAGEEIPTCGSARWVIAQWKYNKVVKKAKWINKKPPPVNDSPFLAQRFDNGVLHVTVEDGFCSCMIARAPGDPDKQIVPPAAYATSGELLPVDPVRCLNKQARECKPKNLKLYTKDPSLMVNLPDPKDPNEKPWVTMTYYVRGDGDKGTVFDVYAGEKFIVRAVGAKSAGWKFPNTIKFKFGQYRDRVKTGAYLMVDRICVAESIEECDKNLKIIPLPK